MLYVLQCDPRTRAKVALVARTAPSFVQKRICNYNRCRTNDHRGITLKYSIRVGSRIWAPKPPDPPPIFFPSENTHFETAFSVEMTKRGLVCKLSLDLQWTWLQHCLTSNFKISFFEIQDHQAEWKQNKKFKIYLLKKALRQQSTAFPARLETPTSPRNSNPGKSYFNTQILSFQACFSSI